MRTLAGMRPARSPRAPFPDEERWTTPSLAPVPLVREILRRFVAVQGVDRGVAIGAHAFTAIVPMLMVYGAVLPRRDARSFADSVIARFDLEGPSATAIREALTPSTVQGSTVSALGVILLVIAALSFTPAPCSASTRTPSDLRRAASAARARACCGCSC